MKRIAELPTAPILASVVTGGFLRRKVARIITPAVLLTLLAVVGSAVAQQAAPDKTPPDTSAKVAFGTEGGVDELHVRGVDLRQVLQMLSTQNKINIVTTKEVSGTVTVDLYNVTFTEALEAVMQSAGLVYVREGNFVYVYTKKQMAEIEAAKRKMSIKVFTLNYITAKDAYALIKPALSESGTISLTPEAGMGVPSEDNAAGGNALAIEDVLLVKDYAENIEKITAILGRLDVRPQQVLVEATILRATLNENNALGIDFNALAGIDFRTMGYTSTDLTDLTPGAVPVPQLDRPRANFQTDFAGGVAPGGITIGFVYNQTRVLLRALESITDAVVMGNPKLLIMNKQRGQVLVGERQGYHDTTTITETGESSSVKFLETGINLIVRVYVGDNGYIRMEIHPKVSSGFLDGNQLPFETTTECTTNILGKDGHTVVIGGLFRESTTSGRSQVPGLGNIPIAGSLFRRRSDETVREEVIILITPHIIKHPVDEIVSEQYKDEVDRIRFGLRREMMWFGRSRLAQTQMRWARHHIARGNRSRALWDLNMTLALEPRMSEAIRLRERLTKEAIWANEPRYSNIGYIIQRMIMTEIGQPAEKVMIPLKPRDGMRLEKEIRDALGIGKRLELPLEQSAGAPIPPASPQSPVEKPKD